MSWPRKCPDQVFSKPANDRGVTPRKDTPVPGAEIKVLDKAIQVMDLLARSGRGMKAPEVAAALSLPRSTAIRLLGVLRSHDVVRTEGGAVFLLGARLLWWETCYRKEIEPSKAIRPCLERIRELTSETAHFSILVGDRTVVVEQAMSLHVTSSRYDLGTSAPLNAGASGRAILSCLSDEERKNFLSRRNLERLTPRTMTDKITLERGIEICRDRGFAISRGERVPSTTSVAVTVLGSKSEIFGVVSVIGPSDRLNKNRCKFISKVLLKEAKNLSQTLETARRYSGDLQENLKTILRDQGGVLGK
jgi:DNA-binding IclR family transcriptional regulator